MNQIPEHVDGEPITVGDWVACTALALLLGLIAWAQPGEQLTVAVGATCGHPVSTKKRLWPWAYLLASLGFALYPLFRLWRSCRKTMPSSTVA